MVSAENHEAQVPDIIPHKTLQKLDGTNHEAISDRLTDGHVPQGAQDKCESKCCGWLITPKPEK